MQYCCNMKDFQHICSHYGIRSTTVRKQLYELLRDNSPILAGEFIDIAVNKGFDSVSVYRTINLFTKLGIVYEFGSGKQRTLQLSAPNHDDHHHFIRCSLCNKVAHFGDSSIEQQLLTIAQLKGFESIESHYLEMIGKCKSCAQFTRSA